MEECQKKGGGSKGVKQHRHKGKEAFRWKIRTQKMGSPVHREGLANEVC